MTDEAQKQGLMPCECGNPVRLYVPRVADQSHMIQCSKCMRTIDGFYYNTVGELVDVWNHRTAEREKMLALVKYTKDRMQYFDEPDETTMAHFDTQWKGNGNDR